MGFGIVHNSNLLDFGLALRSFVYEKIVPENPQPISHEVNKTISPVLGRVVISSFYHANPSLKVIINDHNEHKENIKDVNEVSHLQEH